MSVARPISAVAIRCPLLSDSQLALRHGVLVYFGVVVVASLGCHKTAHDRADPGTRQSSEGAATSDQDPKVRELAALPVGIRISHTPNPVLAQRGGRSGQRYTWMYETKVAAISEEVSIVEFGALGRDAAHGGGWKLRTIYDRPFNAGEFAEWYSCPGAHLRVGMSCADPSNYTGGDRLREFETRWYFIGRTRAGRLVKGEEIVQGSAHEQAARRE